MIDVGSDVSVVVFGAGVLSPAATDGAEEVAGLSSVTILVGDVVSSPTMTVGDDVSSTTMTVGDEVILDSVGAALVDMLTFFNGDVLEETPVHFCMGCCKDAKQAKARAKKLLMNATVMPQSLSYLLSH